MTSTNDDTNYYPSGFLGSLRLYVDQTATFWIWANTCSFILAVFRLGLIFFIVEQPWSLPLSIALLLLAFLVSTFVGLTHVYRQMPRPKALQTCALLPFLVLFDLAMPIILGIYLIACLTQRRLTLRSAKTVIHTILGPLLFLLIAFIPFRMCTQARFIPSTAMSPNLLVNDRLLIENVSSIKKVPFERGQIIVFHAPALVAGEPQKGLLACLGDLTGFPCFPNRVAYIKRIVAIPKDEIEIRAGDGVYLNGKKLDETNYIDVPANYNLKMLSDICYRSADGKNTRPYDVNEKIVVPPDKLFVLGDNRNITEDSHTFGFIDQNEVVGRAWVLWYPQMSYMHAPYWHRPKPDGH